MGKKVFVFLIVLVFAAGMATTAFAGATPDPGATVNPLAATANVTRVEVTPNAVTVDKGGTQDFTATVFYDDGTTSDAVTWKVNSSTSKIGSTTGVLTVAAKETAKTLEVTAIANDNKNIKGVSTVTVKAAATPSASADPTDDPDTDTGSGLVINGDYIEEGMNAAYRFGYTPSISGNTCYITLPLNGSTDVTGLIYCTLNLGDDSGPFVMNNYDNISVAQKFEGTPFYVCHFELPLKADRTNGTYPVVTTVRYNQGGSEVTQDFTVNVRITDGKTADDGGGGEGEPGSAPKVIMSNYTVSPNPCFAGETFTVEATLKNTSKDTTVKNITVNYKSQTTDLMPEGGNSTTYIDSIAAEGTQKFQFKMAARADAEPGPQKIDIVVDYEGDKAASYSYSDEVTVQVRQQIRLEYDEPQFPSAVYIGDSVSTTLNLYNKGKNTLYNVTVYLEVPGITPESSSFLGNMESGASKSADIYASVGPEAAPGPVEGMFKVTYEDEYGDKYDMEIPVSTEIMEMMMPDDTGDMDMDIPEEPAGFVMPWWGWVIIAGGGAAAAGIIVSQMRKKKREKELLEDMDDE